MHVLNIHTEQKIKVIYKNFNFTEDVHIDEQVKLMKGQ